MLQARFDRAYSWTVLERTSYRLSPLAPSITIKYPTGKSLAIFVQLKAHEFNNELEKNAFGQNHIQSCQ
jgi:hypothetical protein